MEILLIFSGVILNIIIIMCEIKLRKSRNKCRKPVNNVHFYVTRDSDTSIAPNSLILWIGKPNKTSDIWDNSYGYCTPLCSEKDFIGFGLRASDFKDLKFEDEPIEVFLNLENR